MNRAAIESEFRRIAKSGKLPDIDSLSLTVEALLLFPNDPAIAFYAKMIVNRPCQSLRFKHLEVK